MALSVKFEGILEVRTSDANQTLSVQCLLDKLVDRKFDGPEQMDQGPRFCEAIDQPLVGPCFIYKDSENSYLHKTFIIKLEFDKEYKEKKCMDFYLNMYNS